MNKILRSDAVIETKKTNIEGSQSPEPLPTESITLIEKLETRTFEAERGKEYSLLAISQNYDRNISCGRLVPSTPYLPGIGCRGIVSYELSKTCGVVGRQYIKSVKCNGTIEAIEPNQAYPYSEDAKIECKVEGNTRTIFVLK